tara:strand:+ start:1023 stop:1289 length:267 start_codon:yes stop_codon:yes gene_type:complete
VRIPWTQGFRIKWVKFSNRWRPKRAELEEQKRNLLQQQAQVRELEMDQIVEQGQLESTCELKVGDNLVQKMQVAIVVRDGVVQSIEEG